MCEVCRVLDKNSVIQEGSPGEAGVGEWGRNCFVGKGLLTFESERKKVKQDCINRKM